MLGRENSNMQRSLAAFAKTILESTAYLNRLNEIVSILESNKYYYTSDLQFMVDLSVGPSSIQVIDSNSFRRSEINTGFYNFESSPRNSMNKIIDGLKILIGS